MSYILKQILVSFGKKSLNKFVYGQINSISRQLCKGNDSVLIFDFTACGAIILKWPLAQLFPAAWADSINQCSVYLS
jgi:hypothetical protein